MCLSLFFFFVSSLARLLLADGSHSCSHFPVLYRNKVFAVFFPHSFTILTGLVGSWFDSVVVVGLVAIIFLPQPYIAEINYASSKKGKNGKFRFVYVFIVYT